MLLRCAMEPVRQRRSRNPRMARANVIGDRVEENLHVPLMRSGYEILVVIESSQMRIDGIKIHRAVSVVIVGGSVFHDRCQPKRRDTKILQIVQMVADAAEIASVPCAWFCAIVGTGEFSRLVVCGVTIGEAIRHDEVKNIVSCEAVKATSGRSACGKGKFESRVTRWRGDAADQRATACIRSELEPDEEVVAAVCGLGAKNRDLRNVAGNLRGFEVVTGEEKHHIGSEIEPPIRRLDFYDQRSVVMCVLRGTGQRKKQTGDKNWAGQAARPNPIHLDSAGGKNFSFPKAVGTWKF